MSRVWPGGPGRWDGPSGAQSPAFVRACILANGSGAEGWRPRGSARDRLRTGWGCVSGPVDRVAEGPEGV